MRCHSWWIATRRLHDETGTKVRMLRHNKAMRRRQRMRQVLALPTIATQVPIRHKNVGPWIRMHQCYQIWGHELLVSWRTRQVNPLPFMVVELRLLLPELLRLLVKLQLPFWVLFCLVVKLRLLLQALFLLGLILALHQDCILPVLAEWRMLEQIYWMIKEQAWALGDRTFHHLLWDGTHSLLKCIGSNRHYAIVQWQLLCARIPWVTVGTEQIPLLLY